MPNIKFNVLLCGDKNLGRIPAKIFVLPEGAKPVEPYFVLGVLASGKEYSAGVMIRKLQAKARGLRQ